MARPRDNPQRDLLRPTLDQIINLKTRWCGLRRRSTGSLSIASSLGSTRPAPASRGLPTRLVAGLLILKHAENLSDEMLCARWVENPYYQYFCGELSFCHEQPFERSSITRWRQRLGDDQLIALIQGIPSVPQKTGAIESKDLERVAVDMTVQPNAIAHPTDAKLVHRAPVKLVALAGRKDVRPRQSYLRVAKRAAIMVGRYSHAHQYRRAGKALRLLNRAGFPGADLV